MGSSPSRIICFIANFSHILPPGNLPSFCCYCFIFGSSYGRFVDGQSLVDDPTNDNNKEDDEKIVELIDSPVRFMIFLLCLRMRWLVIWIFISLYAYRFNF